MTKYFYLTDGILSAIPTGPASGDLSGTYPSPTVSGLQTVPIKAQTLGVAQDGYVLTFSQSNNWWYASPVTSGGGAPSGPAGGDLSGTYPNPTVAKIDGASVPTAGALVTGNVLQVSGTSTLTYAPINLAGGANYVIGTLPATNQAAQTMGGDVTGTTAASVVSAISGSTPIAITPNELQFIAGATPTIDQASTSSASGAIFTIQAQGATGAAHNGGQLILAGGTSALATAGTVVLKTAGSTRLTVGATGVITVANLSTGVLHADLSGNLTSSNIVDADVDAAAAIAYSKLSLSNSIVNADINSSAAIAYSKLNLTTSIVNGDIATAAAIAVSKLAAGTSAQILLNNSTPTPTWTTVGGDATIDSSGSITNTQARGLKSATTTVSVSAATAPTNGQVLTATSSTTATWQTPAGGGGGIGTGSAATVVTKTADYTITTSDYTILCNFSTGHNLTLPAPAAGLVYVIKDISGTAETNNITLVRHGTEKIEGIAASRILQTNWGDWTFMSDGTDWFKVG